MPHKIENDLAETSEISKVMAALEAAERELQAALHRLSAVVLSVAPATPNYCRAEDQLRIAVRAAAGAQEVLRRRLELKRERGFRNS
jgi:hypothetical protein